MYLEVYISIVCTSIYKLYLYLIIIRLVIVWGHSLVSLCFLHVALSRYLDETAKQDLQTRPLKVAPQLAAAALASDAATRGGYRQSRFGPKS